jgi:hypothetical protein
MSSSLIQNSLKEQAILRETITKTCNNLSQDVIDNLHSIYLLINERKLKGYLNNIKHLDNLILDDQRDYESDDEMLNLELDCESYEDKLNLCIIQIKSRMKILISKKLLSNITTDQIYHSTLILPTFHGDSLQDEITLQCFLETFEELLSNYDVSDFSKYFLLVKQCHGRAKAIIHHLPFSSHIYNEAKQALCDSFTEINHEKLYLTKMLHELKLQKEGNPLLYHASFANMLESKDQQIIELNIINQYFMWEALPSSLQNSIIINSNNSFPTLETIKEQYTKTYPLNLNQRVKNKVEEKEIEINNAITMNYCLQDPKINPNLYTVIISNSISKIKKVTNI